MGAKSNDGLWQEKGCQDGSSLGADEAKDIVICHTCVQALDQRKVRSNSGDGPVLFWCPCHALCLAWC